MQMIFFNIGWMKRYAGPALDDPTRGWHRYLLGHTHGEAPIHGHEAFNFLPLNGRIRGYAPTRGVNLTKLGGKANSSWVDNVLVVWFARNLDDPQERAVIVGWYRNARVLRYADQPDEQSWIMNGDPVLHIAEVAAAKATLLPPISRTLVVPSSKTQKGGFGQSCIWYADKLPAFRQKVLKFIDDFDFRSDGSSLPRPPPWNLDPESRLAVEKESMDAAAAWLKSQKLNPEDVSKWARGWDLEGHKPKCKPLLVEVKGLSGTTICAELTPNEYEKMQTPKVSPHYVIFIRTGCLTGEGRDHIFRYAAETRDWRDSEGRILDVTPRTGAILRIQP